MKVHIHPRREWRQPGKATGIIRYRLVLPASDYQLSARLNLSGKGPGIIATLAHKQLASPRNSGGTVRSRSMSRSEP